MEKIDIGTDNLNLTKQGIYYERIDHTAGEWVVYEEASCSVDGIQYKYCVICDEIVESKIIPSKGHTSSDWITEKKATVNSAGEKVKKCTECGEILETAKIAQLKCYKPSLKKIENTADGVKITWDKVTGADKYDVYRKTGSASYSKIATVKGNSKVTYTDKKAKKGTTYTYKIKAYKDKTTSAYSNAKKIKDKY